MRLLNTLKKNINLSNEAREYIDRYQKIYKRVIIEAKKEIMIGSLQAHRTKQKQFGK
jgi:hypothetical protein